MLSIAFEEGRLRGFRLTNPFKAVRISEAEDGNLAPVRLRQNYPVLSLAGVFGAISLLALTAWLLPNAPAPEMPPAPPPQSWVEIVKPMPFFGLSNSEFGREPGRYEARRNRFGGGRIDTMTFGEINHERKPYLRLSLYRPGTENVERSTFFVDMARYAAAAHLAVSRASAPDTLTTRFGDFETGDVTLGTTTGDSPCLGFRFSAGRPDLLVTGVACGTSERPVDRAILFCTLDRLDLLAAAEESPLAGFFAAAEPARGKGCQQSRLTASTVRETWLDAGGRLPPLRTSLQQPATKTRR